MLLRRSSVSFSLSRSVRLSGARRSCHRFQAMLVCCGFSAAGAPYFLYLITKQTKRKEQNEGVDHMRVKKGRSLPLIRVAL
ncbi:unnamed protein product [Brassica rapa]|uniref:Uncharacterized protein n=2 Tax=Brassica TaxID=3705 RepID=A0A8D9DIB6_BRACM|nr:unnamed protein product [Brassica napus]CAG7877885.1 unnamed protein product [Brassica rapa]